MAWRLTGLNWCRPAGRAGARVVSQDENLGSISLGLLYASFTAFSVVGSPVVRRLGSRSALVLGTSGYLLFIAANLAPSWYVRTHARHNTTATR